MHRLLLGDEPLRTTGKVAGSGIVGQDREVPVNTLVPLYPCLVDSLISSRLFFSSFILDDWRVSTYAYIDQGLSSASLSALSIAVAVSVGPMPGFSLHMKERDRDM